MLPVASLPVATMWVNAVALGMLMVGWSVQVVLKNPNGYEERDVGRIPKGVLAMRTGAFIIAPLMAVLLVIAIITHAVAFGETNRYAQSEGVPRGAYTSMADQFGDYVVKQLAPDSGSLAAGHTYIASTTNMHWMMTPVAAAAKRQNVNVVQFDALRESETRYIEWVRANLKKDTRLTDAGVDLRHLNDMLDYNFNRFILTLFAQHSNVKQYVAVYDICDYWFRARMRPVPAGAVFIGVNDVDALDYAEPLWAEHLELRKQWGFVKDYAKTATSWTDVNLDTAKQIAEHLAFVANNLGTYYDDMASTIVSVNEGSAEAREKSELYLQRAVDCYRYANEMNPENISAIFNYYAICNARPAAKKILDPLDKQRSVEKFNAFIKVAEEKKRRYNLPETIRFHGYIRDPRLFASVGLTWAIQAAPDAALATYRSAELNLKGMGDEKGAARINVAMGAIYEDQGQLDLAEQKYLDAEKMDPNDINVLRQLMSLSLQRGNLQDASAYLRRVEDIIRETHENDAELQAKLLLDKAAYYMGIGDKKKARDILAAYTKDYQDDVVGWSMLAMLNIDEGRLDEVKGYIAVNIRRAKNTEPYYTHILDGRLAQAEAERLSQLSPGTPPHENVAIRKHYEDARAYYRSAYASRPNMANVVQMILQIDFVLHDSVDAIRDAETLLQCDPNNPMAFYALGMKRLEDAEVLGSTGAEGYFVRAIENAQKRQMAVPLELLVNAADVLSRTDAAAKLAKAEEFATEAMRRVNGTPNEYLATSTYALVLAHMGKLNEAKRMLAYTRNLLSGRPEIPQLDFVDIWIAIKAGQTTEARRLLNTLRSKLGANASKLDQFDLNLAEQALK
jgi:predicted Zn-dependent protease